MPNIIPGCLSGTPDCQGSSDNPYRIGEGEIQRLKYDVEAWNDLDVVEARLTPSEPDEKPVVCPHSRQWSGIGGQFWIIPGSEGNSGGHLADPAVRSGEITWTCRALLASDRQFRGTNGPEPTD